MQGRGLAVHADVGDVTAGADEPRAQLERVGDANRLDRDVDAEAVGEAGQAFGRVLPGRVDGHVGAELLGCLQARVGEVDGHDVAGAVQRGCHHGRQSDRSGSDDGDSVPRSDPAVDDAHLVRRGQDVGEHQHRLVVHASGNGIGGGVGERHPDVLRLRPVDPVAEDPATTAEALAVLPFTAVPAPTAGAHARHQHPVSRSDGRDGRPDRLDGAHRLMAEDPARCRVRQVAFEDVQVGAADGGGVDADDRVGLVHDAWIGDVVPALLAGTVVNEGLHDDLLVGVVTP